MDGLSDSSPIIIIIRMFQPRAMLLASGSNILGLYDLIKGMETHQIMIVTNAIDHKTMQSTYK